MKTTTDIVRAIGQGFTRDHLAQLVRKKIVRPTGRTNLRGKPMAFRDRDVELVRLVWRFKLEGFTWDAAVERARSAFQNPTLPIPIAEER